MTESEMEEFIYNDGQTGKKTKENGKGKDRIEFNENLSEIMVYRRAIPTVNEQTRLEKQINQFLDKTRADNLNNTQEPSRKISTSSEEFMDTSDEMGETNTVPLNISDGQHGGTNIAESSEKLPTPEENAARTIQDAEISKARMFDVPGKVFNTSQIDEDYKMIDSHIDETIKRKIQAFKFIHLGQLLSKNRFLSDDDSQRLEIINKNGMSFLSPVSDLEIVTINSYSKWEQAFRVYSNVLTTAFPEKSTELLQYNHTIHSAAMSYHWDNVYAYDKEFRHHIARHPYRSWAIILQLASTMLLKDRIRVDGPQYSYRGNGKQQSRKEICKRFNKGRCTYGLSCKYEHHCAVPKGRFVTENIAGVTPLCLCCILDYQYLCYSWPCSLSLSLI